MMHLHTDYRLSALPETQTICALGGMPAIMMSLTHLPGGYTGVHPERGRFWAFPATRETFMAAEAVAAPSYVSPEYVQMRHEVMRVSPELMRTWSGICPPLARPLMRHQKEFCALAYGRRGMINASEQGTGKTATGICLSVAWSAKFTLIVCPRSLMWQWHDEFYTTLADVEENCGIQVVPLEGTNVVDRGEALKGLLQMPLRTVAIINYDVLAQLKPVIQKLMEENPGSVMILDECWRVKSRSTAVTKAATALSMCCSHVLGLTGTPVAQGVADLWSQLLIVEGNPNMERFMDWKRKYERTITQRKNDRLIVRIIGCQDPVGLMQRMSAVFYRAAKATCLDLPAKLPVQRVLLDMTPQMKAVYDEVKEEGEAALGDGSSLMGERTTSLRLQQIAGGFVFNPNGTFTEEQAGQSHDLRLYMIGSPKMDWLADFANDQLLGDPTYRVIVWCKFNAEVAHITTRLHRILGPDRVSPVTGETKDRELELIKASFNSRDPDGVQVIVAQIKKLAYGHNLQAGDRNVYYSHTWSHVEKSQSADRTHRFGRTAPVAYTELVIRRSIDQQILQATDSLQDMSDRLTPDTVGATRA